MNAMNAMIEMREVSKVYQADHIETLALDRVELTIEAGEMVSIMGPSGCGKSTLLNLIGLLDEPTAGAVWLDGKPVADLGDKALAELRNQTVGFVFQSFHLIPDLSVVDNVEIPLLYRRMAAKDRRRQALQTLERVGLSSRVHHFPTQLSGGQQQRVAIARAIVAGPRIVLADEPTGNLDSHMGDEIMAILEGLNRDEKTTIVMVTHDAEKARRTQRTVRVFDGRLVA